MPLTLGGADGHPVTPFDVGRAMTILERARLRTWGPVKVLMLAPSDYHMACPEGWALSVRYPSLTVLCGPEGEDL